MKRGRAKKNGELNHEDKYPLHGISPTRVRVRGCKAEDTITTPFDMTVLNNLDRFHLVMDKIDRLPHAGDKGIDLKRQLNDKLIEHKQYIDKCGEDLPKIRNWQ